MRSWKMPVSALLALSLAFAAPAGALTAWAGPGSTAEEEALSEEQKARLADGTLEFDEIAARIENYNTTYNNTKSTLMNAYLNLPAAKTLAEEATDLMDEAYDIKDDEDRELFEQYKAMSRALRRESEKLTNKELSTSQKTTLAHVRKNLQKAVEDLVIQYESTASSLDTVNKSVELAEESLKSAQNRFAQGMASEADVLSAQQQLLSAQESRQQLSSGLGTLKSNILVLCGYDPATDVTIAPLPDPDLGKIDAMNLAEDTKTAVQANFTLNTTKQTSASGAASRRQKQRNVSSEEQTIAAGLEKMYQDVLADREAYQAAETNWQAAENDMASADRKKSLGMLSSSAYLGLETQYLSAKASRDSAALTLTKAINDYEWAVGGLISTGS
jgi:hypothetical protein